MLSIQCETLLRYLDPTLLHNADKINVTSQMQGHNRSSEKSAGRVFHFSVGLSFSEYVPKMERLLGEKKDPVILLDSSTPATMLLQDVVFPLCN